jgi:type IV secretory pathway TraG/TraD family ATPase VirD4
MTRAIGPNVGVGREAAMPLGILALCWLPVALGGLIWLAGGLTSWVLAGEWHSPPFDVGSAKRFLAGGAGALWPSVPPGAVWGVAAVLLLALVIPAALVTRGVVRSRPTPGDPLGAMATLHDVRGLGPVAVAMRAETLRPSLAAVVDKVPRAASENGVLLGRLRARRGGGAELRASWEDVVLAVMAPRAGKTTALAVPAIIDAPGPVIATSNKADLWAATAAVREADTGAGVWVFDPQAITGVERSWWWNPLRGITTVEEAHRLAGHFIQEVRSDKGDRDFWTSAALDLLTGLLLAASLSGRGLDEVYEWLNDPVLSTPVQVLREYGHKAAASSLSGRQHGAPETRDGVYETARTAAQCLRDGDIMAWVTRPVARSPELDPARLVRTRETLYMLSKDGAGGAAPLVAALADRVMREAVRAAERDGGRLDPPMVVVLDEAANVCRIADLPELYSHLGSRGVLPVTILQSYRQGTRVWGDHGMDALWSAATCKLLGAGLDDAKLVEDVSRLVGDHDVAVRSISRGDGRVSESVSLRRQRVLPPEEVRALPKGTALLLATGCRPAMVTLQPWYDGDRANAIRVAISYAAAQRATVELTP